VAQTLNVSVLPLVVRYATLIITDIGCHSNIHVECRRIALGKTLLLGIDHQNGETGKKNSENLSKLVLNKQGSWYEGFGDEHN
jgi:hypothetical protein